MYRYDVIDSDRFVAATFEGEVVDSDLFEYLSHMLSHTKYGSGWSTLIDLTKASSLKLTTAGVQRMRALPLHMEERLHGARVAILAVPDSPALEMGNMYKRMGEWARYQVEVFTDREEAMRWLYPDKPASE
jgi:hypothetical protein